MRKTTLAFPAKERNVIPFLEHSGSSQGRGGDWIVSTAFAGGGHQVPDLASQSPGQLLTCAKSEGEIRDMSPQPLG